MLEADEAAQRALARVDERPAGRDAEGLDTARDVDGGERLLDDVGVLLAGRDVQRHAARRQRHVILQRVVARAVGAAEAAAQHVAVADEAAVT